VARPIASAQHFSQGCFTGPIDAAYAAALKSRSIGFCNASIEKRSDQDEGAMSFALISTVLGIAFALVWLFVATMIVRISQLAARQERDAR
jgi:hypothetical protein